LAAQVGQTDPDCINMESIDSDWFWTQITKSLNILSYETSVGIEAFAHISFTGNTEKTNIIISSTSPQ
jgi:hypothetical protein